jgi:glycosyltransferase involved in cell wall biosynthesis
MAVYNEERYLSEAVDSILRQTFTDFEFIIVDDNSTDQTQEIIKSYADSRILLLVNGMNVGQTVSLNRGIACARGEFIARMDGDDVSLPNRFAEQIRFLDANPDVVMLGTGAYWIDENRRVFSRGFMETSHLTIRWHLLFGNQFFHPSLMWRRELVSSKIGDFNLQYGYANDYEFVSRVAEHFKVANLRKLLICYRRHPQAMGVEGKQKTCLEAEEISACQLRKLFGGDLPIEQRWLRAIWIRDIKHIPLKDVLEAFRTLKIAYQLFNVCPVPNGDRKQIRKYLGKCISDLCMHVLKKDLRKGISIANEAMKWDPTFIIDYGKWFVRVMPSWCINNFHKR